MRQRIALRPRAGTGPVHRSGRSQCAAPGAACSDRSRSRCAPYPPASGGATRRNAEAARRAPRRVGGANTRSSRPSAASLRQSVLARAASRVVLRQRARLFERRGSMCRRLRHQRRSAGHLAHQLVHAAPACPMPASSHRCGASRTWASARRRRSRRNPRSDGSAHTSRPGAARSGGCPGAR